MGCFIAPVLILFFISSCTSKLDINNPEGTWISADTEMTPVKIIFSDEKVQIFHLLSERAPEFKAWSDSVEQKAPWSKYSYTIKADTISCRYLSAYLDSMCNHRIWFKIYKKAADTLLMITPPDTFAVKFIRDN
jgi:hypothetical protein